MTAPTSTCLASGCSTAAAPPDLMCAEHVSMVSAALRTSLIATRAPAGDASTEHLAYVRAAQAEIEHKQRRQQGRKRSPPAKPVQLALF